MLATGEFSGALRTMTTDPTMHRKQATLPTMLSLSFKNIADNTVAMTTDSAPSGVTRIASVNA